MADLLNTAPPIQTGVPTSDGGQSSRHKRTRTSLACSRCRGRKTRCDGRKPACSECVRKNLSQKCTYERFTFKMTNLSADAESRPRRDKLSRPADRHGHSGSASGLNRTVPSHERPRPETRDFPQRVGQVRSSDGLGADVPAVSLGDHSNQHINTSSRTTYSSNPASVPSSPATDALNFASTIDAEHEERRRGSSTLSFSKSIFHSARGSSLAEADYFHRPKGASTKSLRQGHRHALSQDDTTLLLPRRSVADSFTQGFFRITNPAFPIIHRPRFTERYERLWAPSHNGAYEADECTDDPLFMATVNMIFAIGSQFSPFRPPEQRPALAEQFYHQSLKFEDTTVAEISTLEEIQLLLLAGIYLQSTKHASRCWHTVGMAIRGAQELGIHLENRRPGSECQLKREIRRRTWHVCVTLDRLLALTFSRPGTISCRHNVPIPQLIDDEYLSTINGQDGCQPDDLPSRMGLFIGSVQLFEIMEKVLAVFYDPQGETDASNSSSSNWTWSVERSCDALRLNEELDRLLQALPGHLTSFSKSGDRSSGEDWQVAHAAYFRARLLYVRALLLRPALIFAASAQRSQQKSTELGETSLGSRIHQELCTLCISSVHSLVLHLHENIESEFARSCWHFVHYTFACAITIVAARLCGFPGEEFDEKALYRSGEYCVGMLKHFQPQVRSAKHAIAVLRHLDEGVMEIKNQENHQLCYRDEHDHPLNDEIPSASGSADFAIPDLNDTGPTALGNLEPAMSTSDDVNFTPYSSGANDSWMGYSLDELWYSEQLVNLDFLEL